MAPRYIAWRAVLDDLIKRGLRRPQFLIVDGAAGDSISPAVARAVCAAVAERVLTMIQQGAVQLLAAQAKAVGSGVPEPVKFRRQVRRFQDNAHRAHDCLVDYMLT
jgi:hypothetical protein